MDSASFTEKHPPEEILVERFNKRDNHAFGQVYLLLGESLYLYASIMYKNENIDPEDVVHDVFVNLWSSKVEFERLRNIKAYLYVSIRNNFKNYISHRSHIGKYRKFVEYDHALDADVIEAELYAAVDESLKLLPENYADVMRLFMEGYKSGEIAKIIGKPEQIVYNIKSRSVKILRKKMGSELGSVLLLFF